ncbi:antibiotic biosynthesis monooxygenase family protein [Streptomyces sp. NPDC057617]|uniref:antibiotic biosynthesis monooxygenase family protein n=1 Tax=Streptomyces sp. NPDC057617 TaxID=3346184 RepID=UPI0036A4F65E
MMEIRNIDESCPFFTQVEQSDDSPVTVINTFIAPEGGIEACLEAWAKECEVMTAQPGFISAQLYRGVGDSRVLTNVAVWESGTALKAVFARKDFADSLILPPEGSVAYPVLYQKMAMPGICAA